MKLQAPDPPIAIALDTPDAEPALGIVDRFAGRVPIFKVGLELFCAEGPRIVDEIRQRGAGVFLDLKVNDIPKQAFGAVRSAARRGVSFLTVHGNGGRAMVRAAVEAASGTGTSILVVSVLTSLDGSELREIGVHRGVPAQVGAMAEMAEGEGAHGLVLGSGEVAAVRDRHPDLFLVTPGIRLGGADGGDQRRVGTPRQAAAAGADLLVVGRALTGADDADGALAEILREVSEGRADSRALT